MNIAMLGQKHTFSREGGIEVVVNELSTRMAAKGHQVVCYDRKTNHASGVALDNPVDTKGVKVIPVWSIDKKGLAAFTSSISAAWRASRSKADVVHIHAEGPAAIQQYVRRVFPILNSLVKIEHSMRGHSLLIMMF